MAERTIKYVNQWIKNKIGRDILPLELILFVTTRCNFRCKHCFIDSFDLDHGNDLSLDVIENLASDLPSLMVLMITGGEPFLRDDLPEIVRVFSKKSRPKVVSIATNGFLSDRTFGTVQKILEQEEFCSQLIVTLSFEGAAESHGRNRNNPKAYEKALLTAKGLNEIRTFHSNLAIGANITLVPENKSEVLAVASELAGSGLFSFLTQNIYRKRKPCCANNKCSLDIYRRLSEFVINFSQTFKMSGNNIIGAWHSYKERYQADLIERTCRDDKYQGLSCEAGRGIGVVYPDGSVAPCELHPPKWGNIKDRSFPDIWNDPQNRKFFDELRADKCFCTHECFISASLNLQLFPMSSCLLWNLFYRGIKK